MGKIDIYDQQKKVDWYLTRVKEDTVFADETKQELLGFMDYCTANGLSNHRVMFYMDRLFILAKNLKKPFRQATKQDIEALMAKLQRNQLEMQKSCTKPKNPRPKKPISETTKNIYRLSIKYFYKYLEGNGEEYPEKVRWIKQTKNGKNDLLPEELLTEQDIQKMIDAAQNPRDQALISMLAESGCRITELASLRLKNITFDEHGARIHVDGKTGMRKVRLIKSVHHLEQWLALHPDKHNREAFLWVMLTHMKYPGQNMGYDAIRIQVKKIANRAGITKRVNLHGFRHARATELAKMGLSTAQMAGYLGWKQSTQMAGIYIHMAGKDVDDALLGAYGMKKEEENHAGQKCPRCAKVNTPDKVYCECGLPLKFNAEVMAQDREKEEFIKKVEPLMKMLEDPDFQKLVAKRMAEGS